MATGASTSFPEAEDGLRMRKMPAFGRHSDEGRPHRQPAHMTRSPGISAKGYERHEGQPNMARRSTGMHLPQLPHLSREDMAQISVIMSHTKAEAAKKAEEAVEAALHGANQPLSNIGQQYLKLRRKVPRFMFFPVLLLAFMAACCMWVLPISFYGADQAAQTVTVSECYMMYGSLPPYDDTRQNTSASSLISPARKGCYVSGAGGLPELVPPSVNNFRAALLHMVDGIVTDITGGDAVAQEHWNTSLPELHFLGSVGVLKPQGSINPINGVMKMVLTWKPSTLYPRNVPLSNGTLYNATVGQHHRTPFVIRWHVSCNEGSASCASDRSCSTLLIECDADLVAKDGWPLSMYPWDSYSFVAEIFVYADVFNPGTGNVQRVGVPMLFQFEQGTNRYFIQPDVSDEAVQDAYLFPPQYRNATSTSLHIRSLFKMRRAVIVYVWSMFAIFMMWFLSVGMLLTVLDLYWRPHSMFDGMQFSAIGLLLVITFIRGTQPDIPPFGIVIDVAGFFWNWLFIAIASLICMGVPYERYRHGEILRAKEVEEKEKKEKEQQAKVAASQACVKEEAARVAGMAALHTLATVQEAPNEEQMYSAGTNMRKAQSAAEIQQHGHDSDACSDHGGSVASTPGARFDCQGGKDYENSRCSSMTHSTVAASDDQHTHDVSTDNTDADDYCVGDDGQGAIPQAGHPAHTLDRSRVCIAPERCDGALKSDRA